jgi:hypothetical protein
MNIAARHFDDSADYAFDARQPAQSSPQRPSARRASTRRKRQSPQQFNGIHRRRKKKIRW